MMQAPTPSPASPRPARTPTLSLLALAMWLIAVLLLVAAQQPAGPRSAHTNLAIALRQPPAAPLEILSVTPAGENVPQGRQVVVQFDRPVVPIGRMERSASELPITVEPPLNCEWRWLNTSALACQLGEADALEPATRYTVVVRPGLRAQDGTTLSSPHRHTFTTLLPAIERAYFRRWRGPGTPQVYLTTNQTLGQATLVEHLFFATPRGEQIRAEVYPPEGITSQTLEGKSWQVSPIKELPPDAAVRLIARAGMSSAEGPLASREERTIIEFWTFPEPRFLGLRCSSNRGTEIRLEPEGAAGGEGRCNPMRRVQLLFAAPVLPSVLAEHLELEPDLAGGREDYDPWEHASGYSRLWGPRREGETYAITLPEVLKADQRYRAVAAAGSVRDEFDRPLPHDIDLTFRTDDRPPKAVLTHRISVLEEDVATHLPLVVTNLAGVRVDYTSLSTSGVGRDVRSLEIAPHRNVAFSVPLQVRDWLGGRSGVLQGRLTTDPSTATLHTFLSQVTPFHVHAKLGHLNSAVWVTDLTSGEAVEGASVKVYVDDGLGLLAEPEVLTAASTDREGLAVLAGAASLDPKLKYSGWLNLNHPSPRLFVRVEKGTDLAVLPLTGNFAVRAEGPQNSWIPAGQRRRLGHLKAWGTTAQGIYRVGDTVQYKLYVRDQDVYRFVPPPRSGYGLQVFDPMDRVVAEVEGLTLNDFGAWDGEFTVPKTGAVGWYRVLLSTPGDQTLLPLQVLIADFTPAPFRVHTDLSGELFRPGDELIVSSSARLHSGGPYGDAESRVTAVVNSRPIVPDHPKTKGFFFEGGGNRSLTVHQSEATLDGAGNRQTRARLAENPVVFGSLRVETSVRDDRGKYIASAATARYVGRGRFVGIRQEDWLLEGGKATDFKAIVVDEKDRIIDGDEVVMRVEYRETKASRVKGAGNAYLTQYTHSWIEAGRCKESSSAAGPVSCTFTPERAGQYRLSASVTDTEGRIHQSTLRRWATGSGHVLWETPPGHHLPIEPEKNAYQVGETARLLIRNPFPGALALLSVERLGIQHSWTQRLATATEVIEVEVTPDHLPGFYFSAVVTSPRVEQPLGPGEVDLGKPTFRMGYVRLQVDDPIKRIDVTVEPVKPIYRPRDRVTVELAAKLRHPTTDKKPKLELAVAVLDEAIFDLISTRDAAFDPYRGFYDLEALDLSNFNLLTHLIGLQKFDKKGADSGGGGGAGPSLRSLFRFVSYWNPSLRPGPDGRATIEFEVPDNLTGWRVLAMAVNENDRMGLGQGTFTVNQPLELRPALPNQVIEGDRFDARFTVMNRTSERRRLSLSAEIDGPLDSPGLEKLEIEAEPYQRYPVSIAAKATAPGIAWLTVRAASDLGENDALRLPLRVHRRAALETAANYGTTEGTRVEEKVLFPENMRGDVGRLSVVASPSVIGGVEGALAYARDYPYSCWEQRLSKAVMASHSIQLKAYLPESFAWPEAGGLPSMTLAEAADFQAPSGGMVYWIPEDRYVSPYLSAYTAIAFNWLAEHGHEVPRGVEDQLHSYLRQLLRRDVFPSFYSRGMASSVRAVALAALAGSGGVTLEDLERYRRFIGEMDLFGRAHLLQAAVALDADLSVRQEIRDQILAHLIQSGGKLVFNETVDVGFERLLHSAPRSQCAILSALVDDRADVPISSTGLGDLPYRLTRAITQEQKRRHRWLNTQENLFCLQALLDYSQRYEQEPPDMTIRVFEGRKNLGRARFQDVRDPAAEIERPVRAEDPGRATTVSIEKRGPGRLYYATRLFYSPAVLSGEPKNAGIEVRREYSVERNGRWSLLSNPFQIEAGELVRVDLYLSLPAARNFVVVDDPVPGGLEPVDRNLGTASQVDAEKGDFMHSQASYWWSRDDWLAFGSSRWSFYHKELRHHSARFFSDYLPAGNYHLSYVAQAIAPGNFQILPVRAEEMYDPDVFGLGVPRELEVEPRSSP